MHEYFRRELNEELLQWAGRPLVSSTWVADDGDTLIALLLWTIRNMLVSKMYNLRPGVSALPEELARRLRVRFEQPVVNVTNTGHGVEVTSAARDGDQRTERFDETPPGLISCLRTSNGCYFHVDFAAFQSGPLRPALGLGGDSTPVDGLYLSGAGTHPGGGVSGLPGRLAAHRVLRDNAKHLRHKLFL